MSKHTPGPWVAQPDPDAFGIDDWVVGIEGGPIDYVATCFKRDAKLIAAAPDLLDALSRTLSWLASYPGGGALGCYDQALAAVEKATGESNE